MWYYIIMRLKYLLLSVAFTLIILPSNNVFAEGIDLKYDYSDYDENDDDYDYLDQDTGSYIDTQDFYFEDFTADYYLT